MNTRFGLIKRDKSNFFTSSMNRLMAVFIVSCIVLNGLVPRFSLQQGDRDVLNQIMENQTLLLSFFTFSTVPMKIAVDMFDQKNSLQNTAGKKHPRDREENSSNASSEFSLTGSNVKVADSRLGPAFGHAVNGEVPPAISPHLAGLTLHQAAHAPPGALFFFLIMLMFFFLLPRSSVGENAILLSQKGYYTQLVHKVGFFYCSKFGGKAL